MSIADETGRNSSRAASSSLLTRLISAVVLIPLLVGLVYWSVWATATLVILFVVISLFELYRVLTLGGYQPRLAVGIATALLFCAAALFQGAAPFDLTGLALTIGVLLALVSELPRRDRSGTLLGWALTFSGACYIGGLFSSYILLRRLDTPLSGGWLGGLPISSGAAWIFFVMAVTWMQDTVAYFVGRAIGRHKMAPYLSPKKSWEGAAGGFVASVLAALLAVAVLGLPLSYPAAALIGAAAGVAGPLGDLSESLVKRQIGVKDAGNLIPGHGGVLDRADSMLFTGPVIYYLILFFTR